MKSMKVFSLGALCLAFSAFASGQSTTETFKVSGNCGMCKSAIEKAAKKAGAEAATWDKDTKVITVTYNTATTNTAKIQQQIAGAGYDNVGFKTTTAAYNKLHACCKYERTDLTAKSSCCSKGDMKDGKCADMASCKDKGCKDEASCMEKCGEGKASGAMECCKDGKCTKEGHEGGDCCKKS